MRLQSINEIISIEARDIEGDEMQFIITTKSQVETYVKNDGWKNNVETSIMIDKDVMAELIHYVLSINEEAPEKNKLVYKTKL